MPKTSPKRVLLKVSGEAFLGPDNMFPFDPEIVKQVAEDVKAVHETGVEVAIVVGGGNIFRGAKGASAGMNRVQADQFGMLATIQNGLVMLDMLERVFDVPTRLMSGLHVNQVAEPYIVRSALNHMEKGRVIVLAGGTGNPFCTTDYAAALRASELGARLLVKGTNVDGIYDKDPKKHDDATLFDHVSYDRCLRDDLKVMDTEAFALCRDQRIDIRVFSLLEKGNITRALKGEPIGTLVSL